MTHVQQSADIGSIQLNGYRLWLEGQIDESIVNIHSKKQNQGDPGPDDHPINSTWVQSDWTGGGQVVDGRPDIVTGRFDFATSETMQANAITLSAKPTTWADPGVSGGVAYALGVYRDQVWASWGTDLRFYVPATNTWDDLLANLTAGPVGKGKVFTPSVGALVGLPLFCIPLGSAFNYVNNVTLVNVAKAAIDFTVMDNKLFRLGADGSFEYTTDMTTWAGLCYVPNGATPTHLLNYLTIGGDPAVYVITSNSTFIWDSLAGQLIETALQFPKHPDQGRAAGVWRADLYCSVGDGVHRYNRSTIAGMGLDRDDGVPREYRGVIVDMEPSYNAIYVLVSGSEEVTADPEDDTRLDVGDDYMTGGTVTGNHTLMRWNGLGWHYVATMNGTAPTTVIVSDAGNIYAVWWATDKKIHRIKLTRTYMNLKDDISNMNASAASGFFESSWYNYGWIGQVKIQKIFEFAAEGAGPEETYIKAYYKLNSDSNPWTQFGSTITAVPNLLEEHPFYFGQDVGSPVGSPDPNDYSGLGSEKIKFRFELLGPTSADGMSRPIIKWFTSVVRKMLRPVRTFRLVCNLSKTNGYTAQELRAILLDAIQTPASAEFVYENETIKVDLVALEFRTAATKSGIVYIAKMNLIESNETIIPSE